MGLLELSDDEQLSILQFLPLSNLAQCCLCNKHLSQFLAVESYLWEFHLLRFVTRSQLPNVLTQFQTYKAAVEDFTVLRFDVEAVDPQQHPLFLNDFKTVKSSRTLSWNTVRAVRKFRDNEEFYWEFVVDSIEECTGNGYKIFVGLVEPDFPFKTQEHSCQIVGYSQSTGYSLNLGAFTIHKQQQCTSLSGLPDGLLDPFTDGDIVGSRVDTTHPRRSLQNATWTVYRNGKQMFMIDNLNLDGYSPAVALIKSTQVSIRSGSNTNKY